MKTCSVTCTGTTGNSMTSRGALDSAATGASRNRQLSTDVTEHARLSLSCAGGRSRGTSQSGLLLRGGWRPELDLRPGIRGGPARFRLAFQFGNPPLQPYNHHLQLGNDRLLLHDDGDENIATGGGQVNFGIHSTLYDITTATRASVWQPAFGQYQV